MIIRQYINEDLETIAKLIYETVHTINAKDYNAEQLTAWVKNPDTLKKRHNDLIEQNTLIAEINDVIVGFGSIDKFGCLDLLFVHKDYQNQGIATALCNELEKDFSTIKTFASITARPFFEKRGYSVIKSQEVERLGIKLKNYEMQKNELELENIINKSTNFFKKFSWTKNGYTIRMAEETDAEKYYSQNYNPLDKEVAHLTGCKEIFTREEVISFFLKSIKAKDYFLFLIISPDNKIIGESIINEIDTKIKSANFRIAIFHPTEQGKGIGTWAVETMRDFSFEVLNLHRLSLDVFSFNTRAEKCYLKAGFQKEGVLRDAVMNGNKYAGDILMSILKSEWLKLKKNF